MYKRFFKRFFDVFFSLWGLIFLAIPMLIIAMVVKCESKGPALFKGERVGKDNKPFNFYKFRSMRTDAPKDCASCKIDSNKYITKIGKFIRKTSLDELPQMWCILKGNMSIIGPRPGFFSEVELFDERMRLGVHKIRPGLTGWAQVNGRDVTAANVYLKAKYDAEYLQKITFTNDLKIFFMTIKNVFAKEGIVEGKDVVNVTNTNNEFKNDANCVNNKNVVNNNNIDNVTTDDKIFYEIQDTSKEKTIGIDDQEYESKDSESIDKK